MELYWFLNDSWFWLVDHWYFALVLVSVVGFTKNQRKWFLRRDGNQCMFHYKKGGRWIRCNGKRNLQAHHVIPRGWAGLNMPPDFALNSRENGIILCSQHHVNEGGHLDSTFVVHTDNEQARREYQAGNTDAYHEMMAKRKALNERGVPYWNTAWDWLFRRLIDKANARHDPSDKFPENRNRTSNGREK